MKGDTKRHINAEVFASIRQHGGRGHLLDRPPAPTDTTPAPRNVPPATVALRRRHTKRARAARRKNR